jgi:predicted transcriptional regulator
MINILSTFEKSNKRYSIKDIRNIAQSCGPDTREVTHMLSYIVSFGKIIQTDNGWVRTNELEEKPKKPRRFRFLEEIFRIILILNKKPKSIPEISSETNLSEEKVVNSLSFLNSITNKGFLITHDNFIRKKYELQLY